MKRSHTSDIDSWKRKSLRINSTAASGLIPRDAPSEKVVLHGLSPETTEHDLQLLLEFYGAEFTSVEMVRDRRTGQPKGFAYAHFPSLDASGKFMRENYPHIYVSGQMVKLNYFRESEMDDWVCSQVWFKLLLFFCVDLSASVTTSSHERCVTEIAVKFTNDGSRDVSYEPHDTVVISGLDALTSEATAIATLWKPERVYVARDKQTRLSYGFAFAKFKDSQEAEFLLNMFSSYPNFAIDLAPVKIAFANRSSLLPSPTLDHKSSSPLYWDENIVLFPYEPPVDAIVEVAAPAQDVFWLPPLKTAHEQLDSDFADFYAGIEEASEPAAPFPVAASMSSTFALAKTQVGDSEEEELEEDEESKDDDVANLDTLTCILCDEQFQTLQDLRMHQQVSEVHLSNMQTYLACISEAAPVSLSNNNQMEAAPMVNDFFAGFTQPVKQLRIVKKTRRPKRRILSSSGYMTLEQARAYKIAQEFVPLSLSDGKKNRNGPVFSSFAMKLMEKMGWREGEGLGRYGTGILAPLEAETYVKGAGIGSSETISGRVLGMTDQERRSHDAKRRYDSIVE